MSKKFFPKQHLFFQTGHYKPDYQVFAKLFGQSAISNKLWCKAAAAFVLERMFEK